MAKKRLFGPKMTSYVSSTQLLIHMSRDNLGTFCLEIVVNSGIFGDTVANSRIFVPKFVFKFVFRSSWFWRPSFFKTHVVKPGQFCVMCRQSTSFPGHFRDISTTCFLRIFHDMLLIFFGIGMEHWFTHGTYRHTVNLSNKVILISPVGVSGWPSGLRRQTQESHSSLNGVFWSTNVGVGSNSTSDKCFLSLIVKYHLS